MGGTGTDEPVGSTMEDVADGQMFPGEKLLGLKSSNSEFEGEAVGVRDLTSYGTEGPVKARGSAPCDGNIGTNHGHESGYAILLEGPGS